ncbi:MAG: PAS domain S-box protein [Spirochaetota bacterium]
MGRSILLVEDERIQAIVQTQSLRSAGFEVHHVASGEEAVERVASAIVPVDLVLMDIDLGPGIDGTEAALRIQRISDVPILFLSSHTEPEYVERTEKIGSYGYVVKNSGDVVLIASIRMAFRLHDALLANQRQSLELKEARTRLEELNYLMSQVIEQNPWSVAVFDSGMNFRYASESFRYDFRASDVDLIGKNNYDVFPEVPTRWREMHQRVLRGAVEYSDDDTIEYGDGSIDRTQWECRPWYTPAGEIGGMILYTGILSDTSDAGVGLHAMSDLRRYRAIESEGVDIIYTVTSAGVVSYASPNILDMLGYSRQDVVGRKFTFLIHPDDLPSLLAWWSEVQAAGHIHRPAEYRVLAKDGSVRWHQLSGRLTENPHEALIGICHDITGLKQTETDLQAALTQRDTVFRELKHRTRNSLSVILSLLSLDTTSAAASTPSQIVERTRGSVEAILGLYEILDVRTLGLTVDLDILLEDVARRTVAIFRGDTGGVTLICDIARVSVDTNVASALGLVVNEAVTNAMKHAFGSGSGGTIRIQAQREKRSITLCIEDNGPAVKSLAESGGVHGFGLHLLTDLARQLGGTATFEGMTGRRENGGHAVVVRVPISPGTDVR